MFRPRPDFISFGLLLLAFAIGACAAPAAAADRPNIVFILADDLGWNEISLGGQRHYATPRIDQLAREGMVFSQFYAGSAVCAPSRNTLMTGQHTGHTAIRGNWSGAPGVGLGRRVPLRMETPTLAERLRDAGYVTGLIGKWGLGEPETESAPWARGWDYFTGFVNQAHAHNPYPEFIYSGDRAKPLPANFSHRQGTYVHDIFAAEALRFLDRAATQSRPFFLMLSYTLPHADLAATPDDMTELLRRHPGLANAGASPEDLAFAAMVVRLDRDVGALTERLGELGLSENTLVIFSSDNGAHEEGGKTTGFFDVAGQLRGAKRSFYEGGIRVPTIVRWPARVRAGGESAHIGAFWDFSATLLEVAGVARPVDLPAESVSFAPTLFGQNGEQQAHDYLYWETAIARKTWRALRWGDWKVSWREPTAAVELFDLNRDPRERDDVAGDHPQVVERMVAMMLQAHVDSVDFPLLPKVGGKE